MKGRSGSRASSGRLPSLDLVESEVRNQVGFLDAFPSWSLGDARKGSLFVGAGDSYEASRIAVQLSFSKHMALDPYELVTYPTIAQGRDVYLVSTSGNTVMNVAAARIVKGIARRTIAVTANPLGKLATVTDHTISIPYRLRPRMPGTLSFSLSLLALLGLTQHEVSCDFQTVYGGAKEDAPRLRFSDGGTTVLLANGPAHPASCYFGLKMSEIIGTKAMCVLLEEYGHASLFSLRPGDSVNIFGAFDSLGLGKRLSKPIQALGNETTMVRPFGSNPIEQVYHLVFLSQLATIAKAKSIGYSQPYFVRAKRKLALSDSMIYPHSSLTTTPG